MSCIELRHAYSYVCLTTVSSIAHCISLLQAQYRLLFEAVLVYLESFDTYSNFVRK